MDNALGENIWLHARSLYLTNRMRNYMRRRQRSRPESSRTSVAVHPKRSRVSKVDNVIRIRSVDTERPGSFDAQREI